MTCPHCNEAITTPVTINGVVVCDKLACADLQDASGYASAQSAAWPPAGRVACPTCGGSGLGRGEWHYVRQTGIRNDCPNHRCNGTGYVRADDAPAHSQKFHGIAAE